MKYNFKLFLATSCQIVPFPPSDIGMIYTPDSENNMQLESDYSQFNPKIPFNMAVPPGGICSLGKILIVGVMKSKVRKMPEFFIMNDDGDELFHVQINKKEDVIYRWGALNKTIIETHGTPGDHTTIDYEEPFTLTIRWNQLHMLKIKTYNDFRCDEDGWTVAENKEPIFQSFLHIVDPTTMTKLKIKGDVIVTYVGIGDEGNRLCNTIYSSIDSF